MGEGRKMFPSWCIVRKVPTHKLDPVNLLDLQTNMEMEGYFRPRLRVRLTFIVVTHELSVEDRASLSVRTPHFVLTRKDKGRRKEIAGGARACLANGKSKAPTRHATRHKRKERIGNAEVLLTQQN